MGENEWDNVENITDENAVSVAGRILPQEVTDEDVSLAGSVFKTRRPGDDGALEDTLQLSDFIGAQAGVRGAEAGGALLSKLATSPQAKKIFATIGRLAGGFSGEVVEQNAPMIGGTEDIAPLDALSNATFGQIAGSRFPGAKGTGPLGTGPMKADIEALAKPEVQAAMRLGKFSSPGVGDDAPTWLSSNTRASIQGGQAMAEDKVRGIGRVLGIGAHDNAYSRSLAKEWDDKAHAVIDSPIFSNAKTVTELSSLARQEANKVWEAGATSMRNNKEALSMEPQSILPILGIADKEVEKLRKSSFTASMAAGRAETIDKSINDMAELIKKNKGSLSPLDAVDLVSNMNKYRREFLLEFDKASQSGIAMGENVLKDKQAVEALADVSSAINNSLRRQVANSKLSEEEKDVLLNLHDRYGGFSAVERAANNFARRTEQGAATKDAGKLVGSPGANETEIKIPTKTGLWNWLGNKVVGEADVPVSPETEAFLRAQTRDKAGMSAVKDLRAVNANPGALTLPPTSPSPRDLTIDLAKRQGALTGAGVAAPIAANIVRADESQAEMTTPLDSYISPDPYENGLPRDSSAWNDETIARAMVDSATSPKAPIVQQLAVKFKEALRAEDQSKSERILADLAKIAPELFEPGRGINGRLFHKDEQKEYLDRLHKAYRDGTISADFMHKQQKAFDDPTNSLILPLELPQAQWKAKAKKGQQAAGKSPRGLLGGVYAQIGPARQTGSVPGGQYGQFDIAPGMAPRVGPRY